MKSRKFKTFLEQGSFATSRAGRGKQAGHFGRLVRGARRAASDGTRGDALVESASEEAAPPCEGREEEGGEGGAAAEAGLALRRCAEADVTLPEEAMWMWQGAVAEVAPPAKSSACTLL